MDEFPGKHPKGGGHFQSKSLHCRFWTFKRGFLSRKLKKNCNMIFRKWGRGQRPFGTFLKIHPFWRRHPTLINDTHPKKCVCGSTAEGAVFNLSLLGKVFSWVHRRRHLWCRQEGWSWEFDQLFFSWSTNPPSLRCRRISWWGWRTTTCRPPFWSKSPWWWCGATLKMMDAVRQWKYEKFKLVLYDALEVHFWHSRDLRNHRRSHWI